MIRIALLVLAVFLTGCTANAPAAEPPCDPGPYGTREVSVGKRSFLLHIPRDLSTPAPAVMTLHGRGSNAREQLLLTGFEQVSEEGRFLVVAPNALGGRWDVTSARDFAYLDRVLDAVPCLDHTRVYATGMSMGSAMTFALACAPQRRFAAFGGVALTFYRPVCDSAPPAPLVYFHGTADPIVPFRGGQPQGEAVMLPAVPRAMREWAGHNGCTTDSVDRTEDVTLRQWTGCAQGADVDYYRVRGGGHTWPGTQPLIADAIEQTLGRTTQTVDASRLMWRFFQGYSLA